MPLLTVTLYRKTRPAGFKSGLLDALHAALVASGVPEADRFQRVLELDAENLRIDPRYPDARIPRDDDAILVEVLWSVGRSVRVKRALLADLMQRLQGLGIEPEKVMVCFKETQWENWSFAGGRLLHA
ncbi:tautomerase family protein [Thiomonas bhubaneswarensis]|uniref:Tautomerase enzyme n=1 Tax=Thiomonas bhubaneswarensis TaxID=339866 RepID=A0A0K6HZY2_9BURK|nr:tautomerase family protein [Thiomonas bhubaneswarensis]CUA96391.1 Tautomerase enzyme [Thiomonas bhubaneswarensis]